MLMLDNKPVFSVRKAHETQLQLSKRLILEDRLPERIEFVAGVDVAYSHDLSIGSAAVLDYESLTLVESQTAVCKTRVPYVPTLLSFREIPSIILCIRKLRVQPSVFLVDGQGLAHPYRCGLASHLGLVLDKPTIGVAKSRLIGEVEGNEAGDITFLKHQGEVVGAVVKTKEGSKPIYVSIGHMVSLETAIKIVRKCTHDSRVPKPLLKAHAIATREKRKIHIPTRGKK